MVAVAKQSRKAELTQHDIAELEWLINFIDRDDSGSAPEQLAVFGEIVDKAILHGVNPDDLCDEFGVDRSTVSRWKNMRSAPQPYVRPLVLKAITSFLEDILTRKKADLKRIASAA